MKKKTLSPAAMLKVLLFLYALVLLTITKLKAQDNKDQILSPQIVVQHKIKSLKVITHYVPTADNPDDSSTSAFVYKFDSHGNCLTEQDLTEPIQFKYNEKGKIIEKIIPDQCDMVYHYNSDESYMLTLNFFANDFAEASVDTEYYSANGDLLKAVNPQTDERPFSLYEFKYDRNDKNQLLRTWQKQNDEDFHLTDEMQYNKEGLLIKRISYGGDTSVTTYTYNDKAQKINVEEVRSSGNSTQQAITYNPTGLVSQIIFIETENVKGKKSITKSIDKYIYTFM